MDGGAWWAAVRGVTKSRTRLSDWTELNWEEEEKMKGYEKIFEEIIVEKFPNLGKEIANQVQEAQRVPYRINKGETQQDTY